MIVVTRISRRSFLATWVYLGGLGFMPPGWALRRPHAIIPSDPLASKLVSFFVHEDSAKMVGLEYLRSAPLERDVCLLVDLICSFRFDRRTRLLQADAEKFREILLHQKQQDFECDRTVNVRGWILSQTEVRLCALTALAWRSRQEVCK